MTEDRLAVLHRVSSLLDLGRPQEAARELSWVLARSPEDPVFWRLMSLVRSDLNEYPEALEAARRAVALGPDESRSHVALGVALWNAQVVGRRLSRVFPRAPNGGMLAVSAPVLAALREALRLDPQNVEAHVHLANFLSWLHRRDQARRHYEAALQTDPGNQDARLGLASLALTRRKSAEAERQVREVLRADPGSVQAMALLARTQLRRRQGSDALDTALAAVRLDPANMGVQAQFRTLVGEYLPAPSDEPLMLDAAFVWARNGWRMSRLGPEMRAQVRAMHREQPRPIWRHPAARLLISALVVVYVTVPLLVPSPLGPRLETLLRVVFFIALAAVLIVIIGRAALKRRAGGS